MRLGLLLIVFLAECARQAAAQNITYRWVYRNPLSVLDAAAIDYGRGSKNGSVNSFSSDIPKNYTPRLRYNHMATLAHLPNGSIIAQWQASTKWFEGTTDQSIYYAITNDQGLTWSPTRLMVGSPDDLPVWGPVVYTANGTMHLWYSKSHQACQWMSESGLCWAPGGSLLYRTSTDNGTSWSNGTVIDAWSIEGGIAKLACNGISVNSKGEWLLPYWRELGGGAACQKVPQLHGVAGVFITADQGKNWRRSENVPKTNTTWMIENAVAGYTDAQSGKPMQLQLFRTRTGTALQSYSSNGGWNWTFPVNSTLPNPNSRMDILSLPNNTLVAAYNDSPNRRSPLALAVSTDGGQNWTRSAVIEDEPDGSFHYPALTYDAQKDIVMVIYTVSYPPRLVPVSLVLPGLDDQKVGSVNATSAKTATASESFSSPATAPPAKNASAASFAAGAGSNVSANGRHRLQRRLLLSPAAEAALGDDFAADATEATSAAGLTKEHLALLEEHGYMHVPHMPGYVLEPDSRGYRELSLEDGSIRSHQPGDLRLRGLEAEAERSRRQLSEQERRILKERFVKEQSNFGRVNYGMRVAWVDRKALVSGQIFPH